MNMTKEIAREYLANTQIPGIFSGAAGIGVDIAIAYLASVEENERMRGLLEEAAVDLTAYVGQDYPPDTCDKYPDVARRHFRDLELVR